MLLTGLLGIIGRTVIGEAVIDGFIKVRDTLLEDEVVGFSGFGSGTTIFLGVLFGTCGFNWVGCIDGSSGKTEIF
ncbi:hypothetical protein NUSPORA_01610 [Nucleospora cyclopteri]